MANKNNKMVAVLLSLVMIFTLSACVVDIDFARKGWDGYVDGGHCRASRRPPVP